MKRSSRSAQPLWLVVLLAIGGWIYSSYLKPAPERSTRERTTRERSTQSEPRPTSETRRKRSTTVEGGKLMTGTVVRVSDGDTIKLKNRKDSVRLIGVDCPEKAQPGGAEATAFTTNALLNQRVEIELCPKQPTDRYGRYLGFVYLQSGGRRVLFNSELVRQGYARVYSVSPCTVNEEEWDGYYEEARRSRNGLFRTIGEVPDAASYRKRLRSGRNTS